MEASGGGRPGRQSPRAGRLMCGRPHRSAHCISAGRNRTSSLALQRRRRTIPAGLCGDAVNLDALTLLPLVTATRWEDVRVQQLGGVVAECWTIDDLVFPELSITRDTVTEALFAQEALERGTRVPKIADDDERKSKTELVLAHLVGLAHKSNPYCWHVSNPRRYR